MLYILPTGDKDAEKETFSYFARSIRLLEFGLSLTSTGELALAGVEIQPPSAPENSMFLTALPLMTAIAVHPSHLSRGIEKKNPKYYQHLGNLCDGKSLSQETMTMARVYNSANSRFYNEARKNDGIGDPRGKQKKPDLCTRCSLRA